MHKLHIKDQGKQMQHAADPDVIAAALYKTVSMHKKVAGGLHAQIK